MDKIRFKSIPSIRNTEELLIIGKLYTRIQHINLPHDSDPYWNLSAYKDHETGCVYNVSISDTDCGIQSIRTRDNNTYHGWWPREFCEDVVNA